MDNGAGSYRRFLDGDESAMTEIVEAYFANLVFFADRYVHDTQLSEDIAMDAISDLVVHRHRYNFKVTLKTYLFMIARSRAIDCLRHRRVITFVPLTDAESAQDDGKTPEETVLSDEKKQEINRAVDTLPEKMQAVVHLLCFEELTYEEAARVLKINRKQVDNLWYRAKKELRRQLGEGDFPL